MKISPVTEVVWLGGRRLRLQVSRDTLVTVVTIKALAPKARKPNVVAPIEDRGPAKRGAVR